MTPWMQTKRDQVNTRSQTFSGESALHPVRPHLRNAEWGFNIFSGKDLRCVEAKYWHKVLGISAGIFKGLVVSQTQVPSEPHNAQRAIWAHALRSNTRLGAWSRYCPSCVHQHNSSLYVLGPHTLSLATWTFATNYESSTLQAERSYGTSDFTFVFLAPNFSRKRLQLSTFTSAVGIAWLHING